MTGRGNFTGAGTSPEAQFRRRMNALQVPTPRPAAGAGGACPDCGAGRGTAETLRVHRWLAHDVKANAA